MSSGNKEVVREVDSTRTKRVGRNTTPRDQNIGRLLSSFLRDQMNQVILTRNTKEGIIPYLKIVGVRIFLDSCLNALNFSLKNVTFKSVLLVFLSQCCVHDVCKNFTIEKFLISTNKIRSQEDPF